MFSGFKRRNEILKNLKRLKGKWGKKKKREELINRKGEKGRDRLENADNGFCRSVIAFI